MGDDECGIPFMLIPAASGGIPPAVPNFLPRARSAEPQQGQVVEAPKSMRSSVAICTHIFVAILIRKIYEHYGGR